MSLFEIKTPCLENWEALKIGLHSRHCENCKKDVMDFTQKSREEILIYLLNNRDSQVCGRIYNNQLDFHHTDILVTINALSPKQRNSNFAFYLLSIGTLLIANYNTSEAKQPTQKIEKVVKKHGKVVELEANVNNISDTIFVNSKIATTMGGMAVVFTDFIHKDTLQSEINNKDAVNFAEKMPEFQGGIDSLMNFITKNIVYPYHEKNNKIQGTVYASFIVNIDGTISDIQITESVQRALNFDSEVIRVLKLMPKWIPGENSGKKVPVRYNLPIKFKL